MKPLLRVWLLGFLAVLVWALVSSASFRAVPLGTDAPSAAFSAARAMAVLRRLQGPGLPHPAGTAENAAVHRRLLGELARLGVPARNLTATQCRGAGAHIACGTVTDIIAEAVPGRGKAIVLMAHMDSVPAGSGAGDDGSGVATILETLRALKAAPVPSRHPVIALFTDGEEFGMLGAAAFLNDAAWRARVGVVINAEARGNQGQSYLFQTSPGDGPLIDLYARSVPSVAASSLYAEIYKRLPNDTDLTPFLNAGFAGYNFAFIGNVAAYHTPLDTAENLDPRSLQSQGDNVLGLARGLARADFAALKGGDAIYFDVLGLWLPRLPRFTALPLAALSFGLIAWTGWRRRAGFGVFTALAPLLLILGAVGMGFLLHGLAAAISGNADPSFAHPLGLRIGLAFGAWGTALLVMRGGGVVSCWLWFSGLGIVAAIFAPGLSPYFIFPALVAAILLPLNMRAGLFVAALAGMLAWIGLAAQGEAIMGLAAHPLFTVCAAIGLIALLPLPAATNIMRRATYVSACFAFAVAVAAAVIGGLEPAYSASQPERLNLHHVEYDGQAYWLADPQGPLPQSLRAAARFSQKPQALGPWRGYVAAAGPAHSPPPRATATRKGDDVMLVLDGSPDAGAMTLIMPPQTGLRSVTIGGVTQDAGADQAQIACLTPDCAHARLTLHGAKRGTALLLMEQRSSLPEAALPAARPVWAVPSQFGDTSVRTARIILP